MRLIDADALVNQWATVPDKLAAGAGENKWVADMVMGIQGHFLEGIIKSLEEAPTIDAVPVVHGKWNPGKILSHEFVGNVCVSIDFEDWRCSICGIVVEQPNMPFYNFCPNCGARMDGKEAANDKA